MCCRQHVMHEGLAWRWAWHALQGGGEPDGAGGDEVAPGLHAALLLGFGVASMINGEALLGIYVTAQPHLHWRCILSLGNHLHMEGRAQQQDDLTAQTVQ